MANSTSDWANLGAYTPEQAANLLSVPTATVQRWVYGDRHGQAAFVPEVPDHNGCLVTFLDLMQAMAIREIRAQKRVSLQKIRGTVEFARTRNLNFPFALKHTTYVFGDDVVIRLDDGSLIQATGKYKQNALMEPVVYDYLDEVGFNSLGLAFEYVPLRRAHRSIKLTPALNYGAPTVFPCGYTVATLVDACNSEGGHERAADVCGVNPIDVALALEYEKNLAA